MNKTKIIYRLKNAGKKLFGISVGSILNAAAFNALYIPFGLVSGGVGGLALIGRYVLDIPLYLGILVLNIPIFIWGLKELNREFIVYSLIGTAVLIAALPASKPYIPVPELDIFLASIFSGIVGGLGLGLFLKFGASSGGTDIISMIMKKKKNISVGVFTFGFNVLVMALSAFFIDLKIILYSVISMWVSGKMIDVTIGGLNRHKSVLIISDKNTVIANRIINELHRGVTYLEGQGAFSKSSKLVINTVVNHFEIARIKAIVTETDSAAFMYVTETVEVAGEGFSWK